MLDQHPTPAKSAPNRPGYSTPTQKHAIGGPMRTLADAALASVQAALEPAAFAEAFAAGQQMALTEAFTTLLTPTAARV